MRSVKTKKFIFELNKFPFKDKPKMPNYVTAAKGNNILDQLSHSWAQRIYNVGGISDSSAEQA